MKSLIEEASSIAKAIEKGWERAGKPNSFSVKVFELPEKNFIGMTTKPAKVGLFFTEDKPSTASHKKEQGTGQQTHQPRQQYNNASSSDQQAKNKSRPRVRVIAEKDGQAPAERAPRSPRPQTQRPPQQQQDRAPKQSAAAQEQSKEAGLEDSAISNWSPEMVRVVTDWLRECLNIIGLSNIAFSTDIQKNNLKINFDTPLVDNELKESILYKNMAYLVMASLRAQFRADCKQLKLALTRE
jgi:predicted RNA-binding protein Jag